MFRPHSSGSLYSMAVAGDEKYKILIDFKTFQNEILTDCDCPVSVVSQRVDNIYITLFPMFFFSFHF